MIQFTELPRTFCACLVIRTSRKESLSREGVARLVSAHPMLGNVLSKLLTSSLLSISEMLEPTVMLPMQYNCNLVDV